MVEKPVMFMVICTRFFSGGLALSCGREGLSYTMVDGQALQWRDAGPYNAASWSSRLAKQTETGLPRYLP
jgi:hypothetical protein